MSGWFKISFSLSKNKKIDGSLPGINFVDSALVLLCLVM